MVGRFAFLLAIMFCCSVSVAEEAVEIPLSEVWALNMPETKDIYNLATQAKIKPLISDIRRSLVLKPKGQSIAGPGFIVAGTGQEALEKVHGILAESKKPAKVFNSDCELSVVFFTYSSNRYVRINSIQRSGDDLQVNFQLVPHQTKELTAHLAIIPMGSTRQGLHQVKITQTRDRVSSASGIPTLSEEQVKQFVCSSFTFTTN